MKHKGLIIGALLIIGLFILSPVSASKVIDKGHKTVYSTKYNCDGYLSWETHKTSKYYITVYMNAYWYNGITYKVKMIIQNVKPHKLKITTYTNINGKKSKTVEKSKSHGYTAYKFYNVYLKPEIRSI